MPPNGLLNQYIYFSFQKHYITNCFTLYGIFRFTKYLFLFIFRHNDLPWNIRKFVHNKLDTVNFTHNLKYIDPWAKSRWSHTDIGRMVGGQIGCQVSLHTIYLNGHFSQRKVGNDKNPKWGFISGLEVHLLLIIKKRIVKFPL